MRRHFFKLFPLRLIQTERSAREIPVFVVCCSWCFGMKVGFKCRSLNSCEYVPGMVSLRIFVCIDLSKEVLSKKVFKYVSLGLRIKYSFKENLFRFNIS